MEAHGLRYAVITPARDEVENLRRLSSCLERQTLRPTCWVIVDTGSTDGTLELAGTLAGERAWVSVVSSLGSQPTKRGGPIVRAFVHGLQSLESTPDIVVKLDADISIEPDYFECLLEAFAADPRLGIASGSAYERDSGEWLVRHNTGSSVWGAARAYRSRCLTEVLPLEEQMGWDGIDEIKARLRGWTTETLPDLPFRHHRAEGARDGSPWAAWAARGRASHYMGYRVTYLIARALHHARSDRAALAMLWGYAAAAAKRQPLCSDEDVRRQLRQEQRLRNIRTRGREAVGASSR